MLWQQKSLMQPTSLRSEESTWLLLLFVLTATPYQQSIAQSFAIELLSAWHPLML